jgi:excisionase family DNA binding protein
MTMTSSPEAKPPQAGRQPTLAAGRSSPRNAGGLSELLDIDDVAAVLSTTTRHVRRLVFERRIPYVKVGRFVRFVPDDLVFWLEQQKVQAEFPTSHRRRMIVPT